MTFFCNFSLCISTAVLHTDGRGHPIPVIGYPQLPVTLSLFAHHFCSTAILSRDPLIYSSRFDQRDLFRTAVIRKSTACIRAVLSGSVLTPYHV